MRSASIIFGLLAMASAMHATQALATTGITPGGPAVIHLDAKCVPFALPYAKRWCPVSIYSDDGRFKGYVKAHFVQGSECP